MSKTDFEIVEEVNDVARMMLAIIGTGYTVPCGYRFYEADSPRARMAWHHAVQVYERITGTEVHDALQAVLESKRDILNISSEEAKIREQERRDRAWNLDSNR